MDRKRWEWSRFRNLLVLSCSVSSLHRFPLCSCSLGLHYCPRFCPLKRLPDHGPSEPPWPEVCLLPWLLQCQRQTLSISGKFSLNLQERGYAWLSSAHSPGRPWLPLGQVHSGTLGLIRCGPINGGPRSRLPRPIAQPGARSGTVPVWGGVVGQSRWWTLLHSS